LPKKVVAEFKPRRIESGDDVGIALQILYAVVETEEAGYDLFDEEQLERVKKTFLEPNKTQWEFTIHPHGIKHFYRVFAEPKRR
jgi:hypothetical protein